MTAESRPGAGAGPAAGARLPPRPDVVVIGGGVAGAAAARLLSGWGHLVLLAERELSRPPLAESLPPSCIPLLEQVGVREAVDAAGFLRGGGNTVWWGGEPMRVEPFPGGRLGYQVVRDRFETVLGAAAEAAGAVRVRPGTALGVRRGDDSHEVELSLPDSRLTVRAPWVLDCSGRAGVVARAFRVAPPDGVRTIALVGVWERRGGWGLPDESHTLVESADWGWGWSVPVTPERRFFTAMVDPGRTPVAAGPRMTERHEELFAALPALGPIMRGGARVGDAWACEASPYHSSEVAFPGTLLVGDAASMIDPLSSFGVKKALASAWLAAVTVHTALVTPANTEAALTLFREREAAYVRSAAGTLGGLSRDAAAGRGVPFWSARADLQEGDGEWGAIERLRRDPEVLAAFHTLRERPAARFTTADGVRRELRPVVRGNVVVREEHLVLPGIDGGVRYLRSVDLLAVLDIAPRHDDVGDMYAHYARSFGPVPLPDFLGALSVLVAKGCTIIA